MREALIQVWLKEMSKLFDKEVNAQKEKNFWGSRKLLQVHTKECAMKIRNKQEKMTRA